jgi:hypothetical protein
MFLAHFAAGLTASRVEPRLRLGTAFLAAQLPDALWPYLLLAGAERVVIAPGDTAVTPLRFEHYPWSHSLLCVLLWSAAFAGVLLLRRASGRTALLAAGLVGSHWLLDFASHRPDVPLYPGGPRLGLGMWNSVPLTMIVEWSLFAAAVAFYARGRRLGPGFWSLVALLAVAYLSAVFGPPPPSVAAVALPMIALVPLLWWWGNRVSGPWQPPA